jgi:hypothetical protein
MKSWCHTIHFNWRAFVFLCLLTLSFGCTQNNISSVTTPVPAPRPSSAATPSTTSALEAAAAALEPGHWAKVDGMNNLDDTRLAWDMLTGAPGPGYDGPQPAWDSHNRRLYIQTTEHGRGCGGVEDFPNYPTCYWKPLWIYDDATSTWSTSPLPSLTNPYPVQDNGNNIGAPHVYGHLAWDDANEIMYLRWDGYDKRTFRYCVNATSPLCATQGAMRWKEIAQVYPAAAEPGGSDALGFFPDLNGGTLLQLITSAYSTTPSCAVLYSYTEASGKWIKQDPGTDCKFGEAGVSPGYEAYMLYSSVKRVVVFGSGTGRKWWKIDTSGTVNPLDDAPCVFGAGSDAAPAAADPVSGDFLFVGCTVRGKLVKLDPTASTGQQWTTIDGDLGAPGKLCDGNSGYNCGWKYYATPISTYNVIGFWRWMNGSTTPEYWLYKHAPSQPTPPPPIDATPPSVTIISPRDGDTVTR